MRIYSSDRWKTYDRAAEARDISAIECVCGPQVVDRERIRLEAAMRMLSSIQECKMNTIFAWLGIRPARDWRTTNSQDTPNRAATSSGVNFGEHGPSVYWTVASAALQASSPHLSNSLRACLSEFASSSSRVLSGVIGMRTGLGRTSTSLAFGL